MNPLPVPVPAPAQVHQVLLNKKARIQRAVPTQGGAVPTLGGTYPTQGRWFLPRVGIDYMVQTFRCQVFFGSCAMGWLKNWG